MCEGANQQWVSMGQCDEFASWSEAEVGENVASVRYSSMRARDFLD